MYNTAYKVQWSGVCKIQAIEKRAGIAIISCIAQYAVVVVRSVQYKTQLT